MKEVCTNQRRVIPQGIFLYFQCLSSPGPLRKSPDPFFQPSNSIYPPHSHLVQPGPDFSPHITSPWPSSISPVCSSPFCHLPSPESFLLLSFPLVSPLAPPSLTSLACDSWLVPLIFSLPCTRLLTFICPSSPPTSCLPFVPFPFLVSSPCCQSVQGKSRSILSETHPLHCHLISTAVTVCTQVCVFVCMSWFCSTRWSRGVCVCVCVCRTFQKSHSKLTVFYPGCNSLSNYYYYFVHLFCEDHIWIKE